MEIISWKSYTTMERIKQLIDHGHGHVIMFHRVCRTWEVTNPKKHIKLHVNYYPKTSGWASHFTQHKSMWHWLKCQHRCLHVPTAQKCNPPIPRSTHISDPKLEDIGLHRGSNWLLSTPQPTGTPGRKRQVVLPDVQSKRRDQEGKPVGHSFLQHRQNWWFQLKTWCLTCFQASYHSQCRCRCRRWSGSWPW